VVGSRPFCPSRLNGDVLTLNVAEILQTLPESCEIGWRLRRVSGLPVERACQMIATNFVV
jgi:hypothetical protein